jgi:predicted ATP-dependent endonuclease of OLD family
MKINVINMEDFRQLEKASLTFENDITVLADPNNSGKTTFVGLLKSILTEGKRINPYISLSKLSP